MVWRDQTRVELVFVITANLLTCKIFCIPSFSEKPHFVLGGYVQLFSHGGFQPIFFDESDFKRVRNFKMISLPFMYKQQGVNRQTEVVTPPNH